ncbi:MAG TPA: hypothetical protein GXX29_01930 [Firmicutes bacterium]|nr:hypothetical protein [Bacillota bacterium]
MLPDMRRIAAFYIPLGFTSMLMAFTHWIINAGLARTSSPELALAGWAVGVSTSGLFEAPVVMLRSASLALVQDRSSQKRVFRAGLAIIAVAAGIPALLSLTPALGYIYQNLLGVKSTVALPAVQCVRLLSVMIIASGIRCLYQGVVIREQLTGYITLGMVLRLIVMSATAAGLVYLRPELGVIIGATTFTAGMTTEAIVAVWGGRTAASQRDSRLEVPVPAQTGAQDESQTTTQDSAQATAQVALSDSINLWAFLLPLLSTGMAATSSDALLNSGLARQGIPANVLPGYSLSFSLSWVIGAFLYGLHHVVLVFAPKPKNGINDEEKNSGSTAGDEVIKRFAVTVAAACAGVVALIGFTPAAPWLFTKLMGVPPHILPQAVFSLRCLTLFPFLLAWQELGMGRLVHIRRTKALLAGKIINMSLVTFLVWGPLRYLLLSLGSAGGATALMTGYFGEAFYLCIAGRRRAPDKSGRPDKLSRKQPRCLSS